MEIKINIEEAEFIIEQYLCGKGCIFDRTFDTPPNRSNFVRFQDNEQEDGEYSFRSFIEMPDSFLCGEESS